MWKALWILGNFTGVAYVIVGILGAWWPGHWDEAAAIDQIMWGVLLVGGGVLLLVGLRLFARMPWVGALLVSVGAIAGALVIFWTVVVLLLAVALVVLSVLYARRRPAVA